MSRHLTFSSAERPKLMGILNVTPDSFSDGGCYSGEDAVRHALDMIDAGVDIIDIGGESTRPGSVPVPADEEIGRVIPVLKELRALTDVPISVDTMKVSVAEKALDAGADYINDVNGLRSEGMGELIASSGVGCIIMHMNGTLYNVHTNYRCSLEDISAFLKERKDYASASGIKDIVLDPGVGFGKTPELNMQVIDNSKMFSFGCPVLIGASRKRFLSEFYPGMGKDEATFKASLRAIRSGADIVRVHDVAGMRRFMQGRI